MEESPREVQAKLKDHEEVSDGFHHEVYLGDKEMDKSFLKLLDKLKSSQHPKRISEWKHNTGHSLSTNHKERGNCF